MLAMMRPRELAQLLEAWRVDVPGIADVLATADAAQALRTENPIDQLRADVASGVIDPKSIGKRLTAAAAALAAAKETATLIEDVASSIAARFAGIIAANGDRIVEQLTAHFDKAVADMTAASEVIELGVPAEQVISMGQDVITAWHQLDIARQRLDSIAEIRNKLAQHYGYGPDSPLLACYLAGPLSLEQMNSAIHTRKGDHLALRVNPLPEARGGGWERLIRGGFTLHLNNASEALGVVYTPDPVAA